MRNFLLAVMVLASPALRAEMWKCTGKDGTTRYTNLKAESKGCQALNLDPPNTVSGRTSAKAATPAGFPSVDTGTQRARDADRRRILEQELADEERLLEDSRKKLGVQADARPGDERQRAPERLEPIRKQIQNHEGNIANLKKELANLK